MNLQYWSQGFKVFDDNSEWSKCLEVKTCWLGRVGVSSMCCLRSWVTMLQRKGGGRLFILHSRVSLRVISVRFFDIRAKLALMILIRN